jgi:mycobactin lysine-N-oxygenase
MRLLVIGCGPKALAIYAKAKGLEQAGFNVPDITIIEKFEIGANWCGSHGFTDGAQPLGTPPEKDIGFPYNSEYKELGAPDIIDQYLFAFSWPSYKIALRGFADWHDRGRRAPTHADWAAYLKWAADRLGLQTDYRKGEICGIRKEGTKWIVQYITDESLGTREEVSCDGLVVTGPGEPKRILHQAKHDFVLDGQNFWEERNLDHIRYRYRSQKARFAVIGAGETAASATLALLKMTDSDDWSIDIISRRGTLYTRGEGYHENRHFSNPRDWAKLHVSLRNELIERTDRGVLSLKAIERITEARNVSFLHGEVVRISSTGTQARVTLKRLSELGEETFVPPDYDHVIVALGFDALTFLEWINDERDRGPLHGTAIERRSKEFYARCANLIADDLSITGMEPKVYVPMLAGLKQGPGFPNLSCLGTLSDRILRHSIDILNPGRRKEQQDG